MTEYSCNSIFPNIMREFISNFSNDCGMCSSVVRNIKIEFNSALLAEWFKISNVGFDTYSIGAKIVFSGINEKTIFKFLGVEQKRGKISHNVLSPLHKLLYNVARRFILPRNSKRSEVSLRDATLIYCMDNQIKINFPSLMISHLSDCIEKKNVVGYGGLLTWIFRKFEVPLDGLEFPMGPNMKIGARCLKNLHLKVTDEGVLINELEEVVFVGSDDEEVEEEEVVEEEIEKEVKIKKEKGIEKEKEKEEEKQGHVPNETENKGEQEEETKIEGEQGEALGDSSDEEIVIAKLRKGKVTQRKSRRLASKGKAVKVDDVTSETIPEPTSYEPPSLKPTTSPPTQTLSPPPSPIHFTPPPFPSSPGVGCADPTPTASSDSILSKLLDLQSQFIAFQDETRVSLASIVDQLNQMEQRLGAKLDTVEVQTEYIDEEETDP